MLKNKTLSAFEQELANLKYPQMYSDNVAVIVSFFDAIRALMINIDPEEEDEEVRR